MIRAQLPAIGLTVITMLAYTVSNVFAEDAVANQAVVTAISLNQKFQSRAPDLVVDELYHLNQYDEVMQRIASGASDWIALAPSLAAGAETRTVAKTDDIASVKLSVALAKALPKNSTAVVAILAPPDSPENQRSLIPQIVCSGPFDMNWGTEYASYIVKSIESVQKIGDPSLARQKASCLVELQEVSRTIDRQNYN